MIDAATKDEICFRLMKTARQACRRKGTHWDDLSEDQRISLIRRNFRAVKQSVEKAAA